MFLLKGNLITFLQSISKANEWEYYMKCDEKTRETRWDFIAIGQRASKEKFSGHAVGVGCEGDFACNTLLYDVESGEARVVRNVFNVSKKPRVSNHFSLSRVFMSCDVCACVLFVACVLRVCVFMRVRVCGRVCCCVCVHKITSHPSVMICCSGSIIDPTGKGVHDAVDSVLRIPFEDWDAWARDDRLVGMKLLR